VLPILRHRKLRHQADLEVLVPKPVFGILPRFDRRQHLDGVLTLLSPTSATSEAYRTLRNCLMFIGIDRPINCVQVTSAISSEGKTTVATNLAASFALAGKRVIILDCDLRRPKVHEAFGLSNEQGFTSVLLDKCALHEAITTLDEKPNLAVLPAGPIPQNPTELLASDPAKALITTLREHCDILLIDTPPIIPVADGLFVSGYVDATLLVARHKLSTKSQIARAAELLGQVKAPLVATVLNGAKDKTHGGFGYSGGAGPQGPPPDSGGPTSSDRSRRKPPRPPDKNGHTAKSAPEPDHQTTGRTSPGPTATRSRRVKQGTR